MENNPNTSVTSPWLIGVIVGAAVLLAACALVGLVAFAFFFFGVTGFTGF